eukprot:gene7641-20461_t
MDLEPPPKRRRAAESDEAVAAADRFGICDMLDSRVSPYPAKPAFRRWRWMRCCAAGAALAF